MPAGQTFVPALDMHLSSVNTRRTSRTWPLNQGDVVEIQGPAASGKTHLLYHMLVTCLIPRQHEGKDIAGWGKAAVLFDTDARFSITRLHRLLVSRLCRLLDLDSAVDSSVIAEDLANQCLKNLHVFHPASSLQLAITLLHLPRYHSTNPRLQEQEIGILAIDSLSAFYWRDRYALEQLRDAADSSSENLSPNHLHHVVMALQRFRHSHRPVILLTNWGLNSLVKPAGTGESANTFYRQHLHPFPAPFERHGADEALASIERSQRERREASVGAASDTSTSRAGRSGDSIALPLHYHFTLQPSPIDPFPASYTLADAIRQEHMRVALVNKGEIRGFVRTPGDDKIGEFTFSIGEEEILVDSDNQP